MTVRQISPEDLGTQVPELLSAAAAVALVPLLVERRWSSAAAWLVARAAAKSGRRVALVDCFVDDPKLHLLAGAPNSEGIVDAFEYGASLTRIAQQQPEPNLFFIPAGTFASDPIQLMAYPRWRRLVAGFRHEGALLLLFLPATCLAVLAGELDGLIPLAPQGFELDRDIPPAIALAADAGVPILAAVREEAAPAEPAAADTRPALQRPGAPVATLVEAPRRRRWLLYGGFAVAAAAAAVMAFQPKVIVGAFQRRLEPVAEPATPAPVRAPEPLPVDTLPFAVQVSSWTVLSDALVVADTLEQRGIQAMVVPIRLRRQRLWYRVYAGPAATRPAADALLAALRRSGRVGTDAGAVALVPLSFWLWRGLPADSAVLARENLRAAGVPTFTLGQADGTWALFAGAYELPAQAAYLDTLLHSKGSAAVLGPRVGFLP